MGTVSIDGPTSISGFTALAGAIRLNASEAPPDLERWRDEGGRLLEHVRRVMSIATATMLRGPIVEFYAGGGSDVKVSSQTSQTSTVLPSIHFMRHDAIFKTAVQSFFNRPVEAKHIFFAIEWLVMEATYNEMRLVCVMTALEALVESNLEDAASGIETPEVFEKTRRVLRRVIRKCLDKSAPERAADTTAELDEKLLELNRRSLFRKLKILAARWRVPLDGISDAYIKAAFRARNEVIHRGQYYEDKTEEDADLWVHVALIREVVIRFLFTAIGYEGDYISYVGKAHDTKFHRLTFCSRRTTIKGNRSGSAKGSSMNVVSAVAVMIMGVLPLGTIKTANAQAFEFKGLVLGAKSSVQELKGKHGLKCEPRRTLPSTRCVGKTTLFDKPGSVDVNLSSECVIMSMIVYAGASQYMALTMFGLGTGAIEMI